MLIPISYLEDNESDSKEEGISSPGFSLTQSKRSFQIYTLPGPRPLVMQVQTKKATCLANNYKRLSTS